MRSIVKGGAGPPLLGALLVAALVLAAPGALRAQAGPSGKPPPPPPGNCNVNQLVTAIQKANKTPASDTISLTAGCTYTLAAGPYDNGAGPNGLPIVTAPLVIHGNGATIVRGSNAPAFRFFQAEAALAIDHVTLKNGSTPADVTDAPVGSGGAILAVDPSPPGAPLTVTDSTLTGNTARVIGGAIYAGRVVLERDSFTGNRVTLPMQGDRAVGGGAVSAGQAVRVRDSTFTGNSTASSYGAALALGGGTIAIERSTFTANTTAPNGGVGNAIWFQGGDDVTISDSTFTLNEGSGCAVNWEGGGPTESGHLTVTGSTFDRNLNGGLCVYAGPDVVAVVANSTFVSNRVSLAGADGWSPELHLTNVTLWQGAVWNSAYQPTWQGTVTLTNSIVAGGNCQGAITDGGGNVKWSTFENSCPGTSGDPKLLPLATYGGPTQTMALDIGSAAIGMADPGVCQADISNFGAGGVDQRGSSRFYPCDAGAYESP